MFCRGLREPRVLVERHQTASVNWSPFCVSEEVLAWYFQGGCHPLATPAGRGLAMFKSNSERQKLNIVLCGPEVDDQQAISSSLI